MIWLTRAFSTVLCLSATLAAHAQPRSTMVAETANVRFYSDPLMNLHFYVTGAVVQEVLKNRGVAYTPYLYATGLFDRAWGQYRTPVETSWAPYVAGTVTLDEAIATTVKALK